MHSRFTPPRNNAFSLVELSIVLVILGLLTGGILAGQSLIHAAQLRAIGTEFQRYASATNSFRDKYMALPGDITNATNFWGTNADCTANNITAAVGTETCNGNGNGSIGKFTQPGNGTTWTSSDGDPMRIEPYRFWQHLSDAGLIEGKYAGVPISASGNYNSWRAGWNCPASKIPNGCWTPGYLNTIGITGYGGTGQDAAYNYSQGTFYFGGTVGEDSGVPLPDYVLSPVDAWNIDTKLDDGKPLTGNVLARIDAIRCITGPAAPPSPGADNFYGLSMDSIGTYQGCGLSFTHAY